MFQFLTDDIVSLNNPQYIERAHNSDNGIQIQIQKAIIHLSASIIGGLNGGVVNFSVGGKLEPAVQIRAVSTQFIVDPLTNYVRNSLSFFHKYFHNTGCKPVFNVNLDKCSSHSQDVRTYIQKFSIKYNFETLRLIIFILNKVSYLIRNSAQLQHSLE